MLFRSDAKGNVVPTDSREVEFDITGPAELVGFCNGNQTDHTCMQSKQQSFFNGRIVAIVRGKRDEEGTATVRIKAAELPGIEVSVSVGEEEEEEDGEEAESDE